MLTAERRPLLRREWPSLNPGQQGRGVDLFERTLTLASAYVLRTLLTAIFDHSPDRATAQTRLQRWTEQVKAPPLTTDAVGAGCTRCTAAVIESYLGGLIP